MSNISIIGNPRQLPRSMPKRSNPFQRLVRLLNEMLAGSGVEVRESEELVDNLTGESREVDIVLRSTVGPTPVIVSIEVTDTRRKADSGWVEQRIKKHESLPTSKLVLISKSGFSTPALTIAKNNNADAFTYDGALEIAWPAALALIGAGFFELTRFHFKCTAKLGDQPDARSIALRTLVNLAWQEQPTDIAKMVDYFLAMPQFKTVIHEQLLKGEREFHLTFSYPGMSVGDETLHELIVGLTVEFTTTPMTYDAGRLYEKEVIWGYSEGENGALTVAFMRNEHGKVEGRLLSKGGVQKLTMHAPTK